MKIKTFPIKFIDVQLTEIGEYAKELSETKEEFIRKAIQERINRINMINKIDNQDLNKEDE